MFGNTFLSAVQQFQESSYVKHATQNTKYGMCLRLLFRFASCDYVFKHNALITDYFSYGKF